MSQKRTKSNNTKHPQTRNYYYGSSGNRNLNRNAMYGSNANQNVRQSSNQKALSVIYPVFAYFAVCQVVSMLIGMLPIASQIDNVKRQGIGSLLGFIVLYLYFVRGSSVAGREEKKVFLAPLSGKHAAGLAVAALMLACAGIGLNNLLALTNLRELSQSYQTVEEAFYSSQLGWELLALGLITPVAEELLYRYIIFYRLRSWMGASTAIVGSALIFGLIHMNIVQTVYASLLGLLLGILMEYYQDVRVAICGHAVANVCSLLRGETGFLSWMKPGHPWFLPTTLLLVAVVVAIAGLLLRTFINDSK